MKPQIEIENPYDEFTLDLRALFSYLLAKKKSIILGTVCGALILLAASFLIRPIYQTKILLAPANEDTNATQLAGQIGGLASMAGIRLGKDDQSTNEAIAIMGSRDFILQFIKDFNLKPIIFENRWSSENSKWSTPGIVERTLSVFDSPTERNAENQAKSRYNDPNEPTDEDTYEFFSKNLLDISQDKKTNMVTVSVRAYSPEQAAAWGKSLIQRLNDHMKSSKKAEAEKSIAYLQEALKQTTLVDMQKSIYQLIESQTKTIMLTNARDEFSLKTIDPAFIPDQNFKPKRMMMLVAGAIIGLLLVSSLHIWQFTKTSTEK